MAGFEVLHTDANSAARLGLLTTASGQLETPIFMPVGTGGAVKGILPEQLARTGTAMVLANTYHLMLRPGIEVVERLGGLHRFMAWEGPILTDSGGYQVFSLSRLARIDDDGVEFASHFDGAKTYLNAELATQIQNRLGADIITCLDQCTAFRAQKPQLAEAVDRTIAWAGRCKKAHSNSQQQLFGIVQGGIDLDMRAYCAERLVAIGFDGYAIGGLGLGEGHQNLAATVGATTARLPENKPRYLMGLGTPHDIIAAVRAGVDMFDCVLPTRNGRNAFAFTRNGPLRLRNNAHRYASEPVEAGCECPCCRDFSRATIRHFFTVGEMLGPILLSLHNLTFYQRLMAEIRLKIRSNEFVPWAEQQLNNRG